MQNLFTQLPGNSKVWVYQSSREYTESEVKLITSSIHEFVQQWASHSRKVIAGGEVLYNRFVILAADESAFTVSGCSIDSSIHFIKKLEEQFSIRLFDRLTVAYRENGKINTVKQSDFQEMMDKGVVNKDTVVFNNLVSTVNDLNQSWEVPASKSWHARLFKQETPAS